MNVQARTRLRQLIDQAKRRQIARAHGREITAADRRMWERAERVEREQGREAA